ncbi:hypothetical protein O2W15_11640 [Modestobacter sp. VKM Ac-2979]|uniref:hypothetical protein n=1 Tax=unclassified Modestobacter TaxID=2643866 RepID=UPI0022ABB1F4|nr:MULTISPECIES: hypothetical protein [unclassified Modestobacter]MCZ2812087.1 hypothetical protein [Modestobacter sp. VKM Ac-2979]MCZ2843811.1 hypothetical protein [Modestobacter sp. VKM Ac-2980]
MHTTTRNVVATVLVAMILLPYLGYVVADEMPFIKDPRGMAATGLILGIAAVLVASRDVFAPGLRHRAALVSGLVALALGIAALWAETSETLLASFMAAIVVTWCLGELAAMQDEHRDRQLTARHN